MWARQTGMRTEGHDEDRATEPTCDSRTSEQAHLLVHQGKQICPRRAAKQVPNIPGSSNPKPESDVTEGRGWRWQLPCPGGSVSLTVNALQMPALLQAPDSPELRAPQGVFSHPDPSCTMWSKHPAWASCTETPAPGPPRAASVSPEIWARMDCAAFRTQKGLRPCASSFGAGGGGGKYSN